VLLLEVNFKPALCKTIVKLSNSCKFSFKCAKVSSKFLVKECGTHFWVRAVL
jgi:hypothetical protein